MFRVFDRVNVKLSVDSSDIQQERLHACMHVFTWCPHSRISRLAIQLVTPNIEGVSVQDAEAEQETKKEVVPKVVDEAPKSAKRKKSSKKSKSDAKRSK